MRARNRLVDGISEELRRLIVDGKLQPGELLPSQKELASQFGVGLSTIHEAVQVLAAVGLVQSRPGVGTWVREDSLANFIHPNALKARMGELKLEQLYEARTLIEVWLTEAAALRATAEDIARIRRSLAAMRSNVGNPAAFVAADLEFHLAVAAASGNELLEQFYHLSRSLLEEVIEEMILLPGVPTESISIQVEIADAIERHDRHRARQAAEQHMGYIARLLDVEGEVSPGRPLVKGGGRIVSTETVET